MTDKQPEALRLADWLERRTMIMFEDKQAAAELRRLHEVNSELVEALKSAYDLLLDGWNLSAKTEIEAALAKATGENND